MSLSSSIQSFSPLYQEKDILGIYIQFQDHVLNHHVFITEIHIAAYLLGKVNILADHLSSNYNVQHKWYFKDLIV